MGKHLNQISSRQWRHTYIRYNHCRTVILLQTKTSSPWIDDNSTSIRRRICWAAFWKCPFHTPSRGFCDYEQRSDFLYAEHRLSCYFQSFEHVVDLEYCKISTHYRDVPEPLDLLGHDEKAHVPHGRKGFQVMALFTWRLCLRMDFIPLLFCT